LTDLNISSQNFEKFIYAVILYTFEVTYIAINGVEKMDQNKEVISVMPIEETLIDPLYEPLKLNRYKLCLHLQRLKDGSHVRHGVSPYLLFDVEWMKKVVDVLKGAVKDKELSGNFNRGYTEFDKALKEYLEVNENMRVNDGVPGVSLEDLIKKRKAVVDNYTYTKAKYREMLKKTLYKVSPFDKFLFEKISHLFPLAHSIRVSCPICEKNQFMCEEGKIYSLKEALLRTFELRRAKWLHMSGSLHTIHRAATHTRLSHQIGSMIVGVNALREIDVYPCDEVMISLGEYLMMRGDLHEFLMANFLHDIGHSPLSHVLEPNPFIELDHEEITKNLILGKKVKRDDDRDWYITERYLLKMKAITEFEHRFFKNKDDPVYKIEGCLEKQKECLFSWGNVAGDDDGKLKTYLKDDFAIDLVKNAIIKKSPDFKSINIYEGEETTAEIIMVSKKAAILKIKDGRTDDLVVKDEGDELNIYKGEYGSFLKCLKNNNEILDSEVVTVSDVLDNFGVNKWRVVEILTGKIFCPHCKKALFTIEEIVSGYLFCWDSVPGGDKDKLIKFLRNDCDIDWAKNEDIRKPNENTILISAGEKSAKITMDENKEKATLEINDGETHDLNVKKEDGKLNIYESGKKCISCNEEINADEVGYEKIYDTQFLNKLIHSEIDLDRIDHVKRDSEICGLSLTSFRLTGLLGSISIVLPGSMAHKDVYVDRSSKLDGKIKSPYILVSQDGLSYVIDLLNSRRAIYNNIMFSDENNWINGVVNQITALAVRYLPHLMNMLPFITDQILAHFFINKLFLGTQIEKLNLLFHGKNNYSSYGEPMRYKLRDEKFITYENLKKMYKEIEAFNNLDVFKKMRLPAVVFYTNIRPIEGPISDEKTADEQEKDKKKRSWDNMLVYGKKFTTTTKKDPKFYKFNELVEEEKYSHTSRDVFPTKPNELDVKDLFYLWIYDFAIAADDADTRTNLKSKLKSKENWEEDLKASIVRILVDKNGGKRSFDEWFVPLNVLKRGVN
jgi:HD superfamily phosphohydrolase